MKTSDIKSTMARKFVITTNSKNTTQAVPDLVQDALTMAIRRRGKVNDIIVHSNQGGTYASGDYQQQLIDNKLRCGMSRRGEYLDNAVTESFFASLKKRTYLPRRLQNTSRS